METMWNSNDQTVLILLYYAKKENMEYERPHGSQVSIVRKNENMECGRSNGSDVTIVRKNGNMEYERPNQTVLG